MDESLDEYITKKRNRGFRNSNVRNRLGGKAVPGTVTAMPTFKKKSWTKKELGVKDGMMGKVQGGFDARQRLGSKKPRDARDLLQKAKLTDARSRIGQKTVSKPSSSSKMLTSNDMRIKINNSLARRFDARTRIKSGHKQQNSKVGITSSEPTTVTVAGEQRILHSGKSKVLSGQAGKLLKTVSNTRQPDYTASTGRILKTVSNPRQSEYASPGGKLIKTVSNPRQPAFTDSLSFSDSSDSSNFPDFSGRNNLPRVHIENDQYQHDLSPQVYVQNDSYTPLSATPQQYYREETVFGQQRELYPQVQARDLDTTQHHYHSGTTIQPQSLSQSMSSNSASLQAYEQRLGGVQEASPLQGHCVSITNLHPVVSQEDILELFGALGPLKKAQLVRSGVAEVVYVNKDDALAAVRKYHMRELDGQPMQTVLKTGGGYLSRTSAGPLRSSQGRGSGSLEGVVDNSLLHKALFRSSSNSDQTMGPVSFTVKI